MGKRNFTTIPAKAIGDTRLSALDLRCLAAISIHDGMSSVKGKGAGCFASLATLSAMARTDITNFSKCVSKLVSFDYISREPQQMDRRRFTLRVIFSDGDSWRNDQTSGDGGASAVVGETTNHQAEMVGEATNEAAEIVGDAKQELAEMFDENDPYYISLNEELDFDKSRELDSAEAAHRGERDASYEDLSFLDAYIPGRKSSTVSDQVKSDSQQGHDDRATEGKKNCAEAQASSGASLYPHVPRNLTKLPASAQLARFEAALCKIDRNVEGLASRERETWSDWLLLHAENLAGEPAGDRAYRLYEEVAC